MNIYMKYELDFISAFEVSSLIEPILHKMRTKILKTKRKGNLRLY